MLSRKRPLALGALLTLPVFASADSVVYSFSGTTHGLPNKFHFGFTYSALECG